MTHRAGLLVSRAGMAGRPRAKKDNHRPSSHVGEFVDRPTSNSRVPMLIKLRRIVTISEHHLQIAVELDGQFHGCQ
jgi:hypothetical protein